MSESKDERRAVSELYPERSLEAKGTSKDRPPPVSVERFMRAVTETANDEDYKPTKLFEREVIPQLKAILEVVRRENGLTPTPSYGQVDMVGLDMIGMGLIIGWRLGELYGEGS